MAKKVGGLKGFLSRSYTSGSKGKDLLDLLWRERATVTKAFAVAEAPTRSLGRGASSDVLPWLPSREPPAPARRLYPCAPNLTPLVSPSSALSSLNKFGWLGISYLGKTGFILSTTMIVVVMPLIMEISREAQVVELERLQVKELKSQGYSDNQLQQMGFSDSSLYNPSVLTKSS